MSFYRNMRAPNRLYNSLIFFGTPEFSVPCLRALYEANYDIRAVVTQPDAPCGRGRALKPSPVKVAAQELGLKVLTPEVIDNAFMEEIKSYATVTIIVVAYGKLLPESLLLLTSYGALNIHPSLLSLYRGPSPIETCILNGDTYTGVTLMKLDAKLDHGPILSQTRVTVENDDTAGTLHDKLAAKGAQLLVQVLPRYLAGEVKPRPQDHSRATFTEKIETKDAEIDWKKDATHIINQIRAFNPRPVVWTIYNGERLKIFKARASQEPKLTPGYFQLDRSLKRLLIGTATDPMEILELQLPGKKRMSVSEYINGLK